MPTQNIRNYSMKCKIYLPDKQQLEELSQDCKHTVLVLYDLVYDCTVWGTITPIHCDITPSKYIMYIHITKCASTRKVCQRYIIKLCQFCFISKPERHSSNNDLCATGNAWKDKILYGKFFFSNKTKIFIFTRGHFATQTNDSDCMIRTGIFPKNTCVV